MGVGSFHLAVDIDVGDKVQAGFGQDDAHNPALRRWGCEIYPTSRSAGHVIDLHVEDKPNSFILFTTLHLEAALYRGHAMILRRIPILFLLCDLD